MNETKTPGQAAYEKYTYYQLLQIRSLTWEELKECMDGEYCRQWEEIAGAAVDQHITLSMNDGAKTPNPDSGGKLRDFSKADIRAHVTKGKEFAMKALAKENTILTEIPQTLEELYDAEYAGTMDSLSEDDAPKHKHHEIAHRTALNHVAQKAVRDKAAPTLESHEDGKPHGVACCCAQCQRAREVFNNAYHEAELSLTPGLEKLRECRHYAAQAVAADAVAKKSGKDTSAIK